MTLTPEQKLLEAILLDALECYIDHVGTAKGRNAARWIFGNFWAPVSLNDVCEALHIDPDALRGNLKKGRTILPFRSHTVSRLPQLTIDRHPRVSEDARLENEVFELESRVRILTDELEAKRTRLNGLWERE